MRLKDREGVSARYQVFLQTFDNDDLGITKMNLIQSYHTERLFKELSRDIKHI